jgi:asparagine synthase (glutamine-hydrolysing)
MCGIFAVLEKNPTKYNDLVKAGMATQHRGPDNTSKIMIITDNITSFFMFHRLSINGLSESGNQPMSLTLYPHITLMANGEIYNFKELAKKYNFKLITGSDCEIIIHLYNKVGIDECIKQLDGVFSFVIMDSNKQLFIIGHDPIGIRELYWAKNSNGIYVGSELKNLSKITENIELFPPGTYGIYDIKNNNYENKKYYDLSFNSLYDNDDEIIENIRDKLFKSVNKRLLSDREIGCLLSGGIDSSIITLITSKIIGADKLKTFSIGLEGSPDLLAAKKVAEHLGTNHTEVIVTEEELLNEIPDTIKQIETFDITTIRASTPMYLLSKYIKKNTDITVILSGEGADESSGSYLYFHKAPNPFEFQKECIRLIKDVQHFDVLRGDKTTAGASLEIRVPFFDKEFINFYMSINPDKKVPRNKYEKYLLRKSFENELPSEIIWRRKDGFSDGVSSQKKSWYEIIDQYVKEKVPDLRYDYDYMPPPTDEAAWYRNLFEEYYPGHEKIVPYYWQPKWTNTTNNNPSGRLFMEELD